MTNDIERAGKVVANYFTRVLQAHYDAHPESLRELQEEVETRLRLDLDGVVREGELSREDADDMVDPLEQSMAEWYGGSEAAKKYGESLWLSSGNNCWREVGESLRPYEDDYPEIREAYVDLLQAIAERGRAAKVLADKEEITDEDVKVAVKEIFPTEEAYRSNGERMRDAVTKLVNLVMETGGASLLERAMVGLTCKTIDLSFAVNMEAEIDALYS